jgi:hypothetical protein
LGIEWFRDLSLTILGFVATVVLILVAILVYRLYRTLTAALDLAKTTSEIVLDTVTLLQGGPVAMILTLIRSFSPTVRALNQKVQKRKYLGRKR